MNAPVEDGLGKPVDASKSINSDRRPEPVAAGEGIVIPASAPKLSEESARQAFINLFNI